MEQVNLSNRNFNTISPSAKWILLMKGHTNIPFARQTAELISYPEKFNPDFTKKPPKRCIASPLGSTWKADGDIVICPDRRWSAHKPNMVMGNFVKEGLNGIRKKWGGLEHKLMIEESNKHISECIRCTAYAWHDIYEHCVENDDLDVTLI